MLGNGPARIALCGRLDAPLSSHSVSVGAGWKLVQVSSDYGYLMEMWRTVSRGGCVGQTLDHDRLGRPKIASDDMEGTVRP